MRTTVDIPDTLGRQVKSRAALSGQSLKHFIIHALECQLAAGVSNSLVRTDRALPVIRSRKPGSLKLTPDEVSALLVREEAAAYGTALRR